MEKNKRGLVKPEILKKVALEYSIKGATLLAKEIGVSKQRISQIVAQLRKQGVNIDRPRHYGINFKEAISDLKNKHPELFKDKK